VTKVRHAREEGRGAQLSERQEHVVRRLVEELATLPGVLAVALGGSRARGRARADSDVDLGILYAEAAPFDPAALRALADGWNDRPDPVVTDFHAWGPYVNGGAWLTVEGERVDLLYRSVEHLERVLADAEAGRHTVHHGQQPPFGFWSGTAAAELAIALPLHDPAGRLAALKKRAERFPEALRRAVASDGLWAVEFGLRAFAPKLAAAGDVYGSAGCLTRFAHQLVLVLFALNRAWLVNDKTALAEIADFALAPERFGERVTAVLARPGATPAELAASFRAFAELLRETAALAGPLYAPRFALPGGGR
jgi:predicted nucleotidyltransferase